jgi:hypothetical protein
MQGEACWSREEVLIGALRHRASRLAVVAVETLRGEIPLSLRHPASG